MNNQQEAHVTGTKRGRMRVVGKEAEEKDAGPGPVGLRVPLAKPLGFL